MSKIYDSFLFFNEVELLKLRMNILKDVVDYFVIVESTTTFSSKPKKLIYDENKELFKEFEDKIIHVIINDTPLTFTTINYFKNPSTEDDLLTNKILKYVEDSVGWNHSDPGHNQWGVETYQRECIVRGLVGCEEDDIVILSDIDEIPNPLEIKTFTNKDEVFEFKQKMYYYYLNLLKEENWSGSKMFKYSLLKHNPLNKVRQNKYTTKIINNGGWHFSFMGGEEKIIEKIESYAHQEFNTDYYKNNIKNRIDSNDDIFNRGKLNKVLIDDTYPTYLIDNIDHYSHMLKD